MAKIEGFVKGVDAVADALSELAERAAAGDEVARKGIRAYHGSPHEFDQFDFGRMGTGQGAQAYGPGGYFAEGEKYAEGFMQAGTGTKVQIDGEDLLSPASRALAESDPEYAQAANYLNMYKTPDQAMQAAADDGLVGASERIKSMLDSGRITTTGKGHMYEVNIDAARDEFLNWDKPLSEQKRLLKALDDKYGDHEIVLQQLGLDIKYEDPTGGDLGMALGMTRGGQTEPPKLLTDVGVKGVEFADAHTRHKSPDKRSSNFTVFDDRIVDITKKYGISIPAAAAVLAGTMTPEEAQAGPLSAGRRIIDPRFTNALGGGPRKGLQDTIETMGTTVDQRAMNMGDERNLYDFEGSPYILTQSDRSAAGGTLTGVHGKDIDPVNLRGGRDYMFDPDTQDLVWVSDPNVVKSLAARAAQLRKDFGRDPILLPYAMAPTGIDFATMPLDTMVNYARQGMSKANIRKLDSQIKKVIPSWKGVMDPEANAVFRDVPGDKRKYVANIIDKNFRNENGGLSISEARAATSDAGQYLTPDGTLRNVGVIDTSRQMAPSDHPTYRGGLPGEGIGTLKEDLNVRPFMENAGRELTGDAADIRSLSMNPSFSQGVIDDKLLRKIYDTQGGRLREIATKYGVSIPVAAMALMGSPEEASASEGGMGVQSAPPVADETPWAPEPEQPTGGDLMADANKSFLDSIISQPGSFFDPNTYDDIGNTARGAFDTMGGAMGDIESALVGGIMQGIGGATTWQDALKMLGGGVGQEIINTPDAGSKFLQGMENYDSVFPTSEQIGAEPGIVPAFGTGDKERASRFKGLGGLFSPI